MKTPQQLYEDWERAHWAAQDIDLSRDVEHTESRTRESECGEFGACRQHRPGTPRAHRVNPLDRPPICGRPPRTPQ
jgi:hypothetical protein